MAPYDVEFVVLERIELDVHLQSSKNPFLETEHLGRMVKSA